MSSSSSLLLLAPSVVVPPRNPSFAPPGPLFRSPPLDSWLSSTPTTRTSSPLSSPPGPPGVGTAGAPSAADAPSVEAAAPGVVEPAAMAFQPKLNVLPMALNVPAGTSQLKDRDTFK